MLENLKLIFMKKKMKLISDVDIFNGANVRMGIGLGVWAIAE